MGVLNYLKGVFGQPGRSRYSIWLTDSQPVFRAFGQDVYLSDFVNNAIDRIASEISKIEIKSVVQADNSVRVLNDDITRLFRFNPNPLQTTSDFLANVEWLRRKNRNAFIYPRYVDRVNNGVMYRTYIAFYPLNPQAVHIGVNGSQVWEVKLDFEDGSSFVVPYSELIHLKWRRGTNTVVGGGDDDGRINDKDLRNTIEALDKTIQGLPKSIEASLQVKGVYTAKSLFDQVKRDNERADFESHILKSKSGIVALDLAGEFTPVNIRAPEIPDAAMKFLKAVIQERYGISAAILSGDFSGSQHDAFYQSAIEDFIIQLEQAMTACLFSTREKDVGHRVKAYYRKVRYFSTSDKLALANLARETGIMTLNEVNEMFGIEPFPDGNRRLQSLNYVNIEDVDAYQKGRAGIDKQEGNDEN
jgi:hypothetical protein